MACVRYKLPLAQITLFQRRDNLSRKIPCQEKQYHQRRGAENQGIADQCFHVFQHNRVIQKRDQRIISFILHTVDQVVSDAVAFPAFSNLKSQFAEPLFVQ